MHLLNAARRNFPLTTPALPIVHALDRQLKRIDQAGGLPARFARHTALAAMMVQWAESRSDVKILADPPRRSPTVTALELTNGRVPSELVKTLAGRGLLITTGLAPLAQKVIRIGHMGDLDVSHLAALLEQLEAVL